MTIKLPDAKRALDITPTPEQQALLDCKHSFFAFAGAGCAKSTTLELLANSKKSRILVLAYNKRIKLSLAEKMPSHVRVETFHAMALSVINKNVNQATGYKLVERYLPRDSKKEMFQLSSDLDKALLQAVENEAQYFDAFHKQGEVPSLTWPQYQELSELILKERQATFSSAIYEAGRVSLSNFPYDIVFVDEAQDVNPGMFQMLKNIQKQHPSVVFGIVGDPAQAIYGFTGTLQNACFTLAAQFKCQHYPLQTCFRCPEAVVRLVNKFCPFSKLVPFKSGGETSTITNREALLSQLEHKLTLKKPTVVLARTNAELAELSSSLIKRKISHSFAAKDIGQALLDLINKSNFNYLETKQDVKVLTQKGLNEKQDLRRTLQILLGQTDSLAELRILIDRLFFVPKDVCIILSTAHSAKGLEWHSVFVLMHNMAKHSPKSTSEQNQQEQNLLYVAMTRALWQLTLCY